MHRCLPIIDPNKAFRFFDLPPELRLKIYEEVLEIKTNELGERDSIFSPQLLRASKQCHAESEAVLYGRNQVTINIESELRLIVSDDYYHDTVSIEIGGRVVAQGGSSASLGFPVCMAATWPSYVQKARDIRIKLFALDMRDGDGVEGFLWSLMFPRLVEESTHSRGGGFVSLSQLATSLAQAATNCRRLHLNASAVDQHGSRASLQIDRVLNGMAAFANVTKCEVETLGEPSEGARLRALILGPVPTRPARTSRRRTGAVRGTQRTVDWNTIGAWYEIPALLPDSLDQVANAHDPDDPERGSTPDLPDDTENILQPLWTFREPPGPRRLVLWSAT